jgi:hypothetical protein
MIKLENPDTGKVKALKEGWSEVEPPEGLN